MKIGGIFMVVGCIIFFPLLINVMSDFRYYPQSPSFLALLIATCLFMSAAVFNYLKW